MSLPKPVGWIAFDGKRHTVHIVALESVTAAEPYGPRQLFTADDVAELMERCTYQLGPTILIDDFRAAYCQVK